MLLVVILPKASKPGVLWKIQLDNIQKVLRPNTLSEFRYRRFVLTNYNYPICRKINYIFSVRLTYCPINWSNVHKSGREFHLHGILDPLSRRSVLLSWIATFGKTLPAKRSQQSQASIISLWNGNAIIDQNCFKQLNVVHIKLVFLPHRAADFQGLASWEQCSDHILSLSPTNAILKVIMNTLFQLECSAMNLETKQIKTCTSDATFFTSLKDYVENFLRGDD